ncbi:MAG TPA: ACT domain-containing protein [Burkholderiales bacterium]|nr:ACT domain-containing protein [Burkholderiales bacterium]
MTTSLVVTIVGPDRPGLVSWLSDKATAHGANWAESRMANLAGQFAGILRLQVQDAKADALIAALNEIKSLGLDIVVAKSNPTSTAVPSRLLNLELVGQDRPGIVRDISRTLADQGVSIEELHTELVSGSWSGENLFQAKAKLRVPTTIATDELRNTLEALANELMVDLNLDNATAKA